MFRTTRVGNQSSSTVCCALITNTRRSLGTGEWAIDRHAMIASYLPPGATVLPFLGLLLEMPMPVRVLVTDDDPATLAFYGELLEDAGYCCVLHQGPHLDVTEVAQVAPDLMIEDWVVGGQTGYQTLSRVRHAPETAHI